MTLKQFKNKEDSKSKSSLFKFETEILELLKDNYSHQKIAEFLNANGVKTSRQNVGKWINRNKSKSPVIAKKVIGVEKPKASVVEKESHNKATNSNKSLFKKSENIKKDEILEADLNDVVYS